MTCPRCRGLVVPDRDFEVEGFPVYCINCGWRGDSRMPKELETIAVLIEPATPKRKRGRPPLSPEERQRRLDRHFPLSIQERLRRERISQAMRLWHLKQGHQCSTDTLPALGLISTDAARISPPHDSAPLEN